jgi:hypothetical protein
MLVARQAKKKYYPNAQVEFRAFNLECQLQSDADSMETHARWFANKDLVIMVNGWRTFRLKHHLEIITDGGLKNHNAMFG